MKFGFKANGRTWKERKELTFRTRSTALPNAHADYIGNQVITKLFLSSNEDSGSNHYVQTQSNINELYFIT